VCHQCIGWLIAQAWIKPFWLIALSRATMTTLWTFGLQEASDQTLMLDLQRREYGRSQADRDLQWEHNQIFDFASKLQDFMAADADEFKV
jgi:hypothetical protein